MSLSPQAQGREFKALAMASARAADEKKGDGIVVLHVGPVSTLADYVLLVNITSPNHLGAVEEHIARALKDLGYTPNHRDGRRSDQWRVLDYGGLIIHLLHPRARTFYSVDRLFPGARKVRCPFLERKTSSIQGPRPQGRRDERS